MTEYETFVVKRNNARDLRFDGRLIADADTKTSSSTRWTELELYRTRGGKYIAASVGRTMWEGELDRYDAKVCETEDDVIKFFGHGWLAKELYENACIECVEEVG